VFGRQNGVFGTEALKDAGPLVGVQLVGVKGSRISGAMQTTPVLFITSWVSIIKISGHIKVNKGHNFVLSIALLCGSWHGTRWGIFLSVVALMGNAIFPSACADRCTSPSL
jgi:hypothetical protein